MQRVTTKNVVVVIGEENHAVSFGSSQQYHAAIESLMKNKGQFFGSLLDEIQFTFCPSSIRAVYFQERDLREDNPFVTMSVLMDDARYDIPVKSITRARNNCKELSNKIGVVVDRWDFLEVLQETGKTAYIRHDSVLRGLMISMPKFLISLNEEVSNASCTL